VILPLGIRLIRAVADDPKRAMVDAAEALMADRGIAAVSLSEVQAAAGQRNKSAAHYHFGTREGLINAILETRTKPINEQRLAMLDALAADDRNGDLRALCRVLVDPLVNMTVARRGTSYARFLAHSYRDPVLVRAFERSAQGAGIRRWRERVADCLADVPPPLRRVRIDRVVSLVIVTVAAWESGGGGRRLPLQARTADLVDTCVAILEAAVSAETTAALA
jgi:AcrR family transcriptional regulator